LLNSIIIPAKNEPYLPLLLGKINKIIDAEILVETAEGLGQAVRNGIKKSKGDNIIIIDADGQHNPKYLPKFIEALETHEMVIGSRYLDGGGDQREFYRKIMSKIATTLAKLKLNNGIKDPLSGFFGFRKKILNKINLNCNGFKIGFEILMKTKPTVKEIPVIIEKRKIGESKANFKEIVRVVNLLCR